MDWDAALREDGLGVGWVDRGASRLAPDGGPGLGRRGWAGRVARGMRSRTTLCACGALAGVAWAGVRPGVRSPCGSQRRCPRRKRPTRQCWPPVRIDP
eukprot:scaffold16721_cov87-Isochrysis_galbana.AAC.3